MIVQISDCVADTESVGDFIEDLLEFREANERFEQLSERCALLGRALLDFAAGMGYSFARTDSAGNTDDSSSPSATALERLFWMPSSDIEFQLGVSRRFPGFVACLLPTGTGFRGLHSHLGVVFWAAKTSLKDINEDEYRIVDESYRYVCEAISPMSPELETCFRMATKRWQMRQWDAPLGVSPTTDAIQAVCAVFPSSFLASLPSDVAQEIDEQPEIAWLRRIYPALCGSAMANLAINGETLWKHAVASLMAMEMAPGIRRSIVGQVVVEIPSIEDLMDFFSLATEHLPTEELPAFYEAVGAALHNRD